MFNNFLLNKGFLVFNMTFKCFFFSNLQQYTIFFQIEFLFADPWARTR